MQIIVLAVVQGVTEFLPISSSGHLLLVPLLTDWPDQGLELDIATHVGTLLAVLLFFRSDLWGMTQALFNRGDSPELGRRLIGHLILGSIPAVIAGGLLFYLFMIDFRSLLVIAATTILFGVLLGFADWRFKGTRTLDQMTRFDALFIGFFQVFALIPGSSRSGVTMTAALLSGFERKEAARFSMLLSIPVIVGAGLVAGIKLYSQQNLQMETDALIVGGISFAVAFCVISLLMRWIQTVGFMPFVIYRLLLGAYLLAVYFA
nr:undecaprenyl-diphosphate phosphatase [Sneathiella chinensis]